MSDPVTAAKSARESLAHALGAIQADATVPQQLMAIAEPISAAMGALFQIERSGGAAIATHASIAVESVRRALSMLQQEPSNHPAVQRALEGVAGSLGLVHSLVAQRSAPLPQQPYAQPGYAPPAQPQAALRASAVAAGVRRHVRGAPASRRGTPATAASSRSCLRREFSEWADDS